MYLSSHLIVQYVLSVMEMDRLWKLLCVMTNAVHNEVPEAHDGVINCLGVSRKMLKTFNEIHSQVTIITIYSSQFYGSIDISESDNIYHHHQLRFVLNQS